jgi:hypothetical protein
LVVTCEQLDSDTNRLELAETEADLVNARRNETVRGHQRLFSSDVQAEVQSCFVEVQGPTLCPVADGAQRSACLGAGQLDMGNKRSAVGELGQRLVGDGCPTRAEDSATMGGGVTQ